MQLLNLPTPPIQSKSDNTKRSPSSPASSVESLQNAINQYQKGQCGIGAVKACWDLISTHIAMADKYVVRVEEDGTYEILWDHDLTRLFKNPSKTMNAFQFETLMINMMLGKGNSYAIIRRSSRDKFTPIELIPADFADVYRKNGKIYYN